MKKKVLDIIYSSTTKHVFDFKKYALINFFFRFIEITKNQLKVFLPQFHAIGNIKVCRYVCLFENIIKSILTYFLILIKINMYYKKNEYVPNRKNPTDAQLPNRTAQTV